MTVAAQTATTASKTKSAAQRFGVIERPAFEWNADVERETAHLYERVAHHIPKIEWPVYAPYVAAINRLKKERNAAILAHNYQTLSATVCNWRKKPPRLMPRSSSSAASTSWPRRPSCSIPKRQC